MKEGKRKIRRDCRGSTTIEATLVFTMVIFILSCLVLSFMLLYHKALLTRTASYLANEAVCLLGTGDGLYTGIVEGMIPWEARYTLAVEKDEGLAVKSGELLEEIKSCGEGRERRIKTLQLMACHQLTKGIRNVDRTEITIVYDRRLFNREVKVELVQEVQIPFGRLKYFFDGKETAVLTASGRAAVLDPAGYIRNVDMVLEYGSDVLAFFKTKEEID